MVEPKKYPKTNIFVNKLDIQNSKKLDKVEQFLSTRRAFYLIENPAVIGGVTYIDYFFDLDHLKKAIHKYLFQDVYTWAGEIRSFNMAKDIDIFTPPEKIEFYFETLAQEIREYSFLKDKERPYISKKLAHYLGKLNMIHPFPDGNGRTQRVFLTLLARSIKYDLEWSKVHSWENMVTAQNVHRNKDYVGLELMIDRILIDSLA